MKNERAAATLVGILYIIGTAAGVASMVPSQGVSGTRASLAALASNPNPALVTALLILVMAVALAIIPAVLFPIVKRESEALAVGYAIFRGALEVPLLIGSAVCWIMLAIIAGESAGAATATAPLYSGIGTLILAAREPIAATSSIAFSIGALMLYYAMYRSGLVPRWLALWGLVAAVLYLSAGVINVIGPEFGPLYAPMGLQEMVMAVWLIVKGFGPGTVASRSALQPAGA